MTERLDLDAARAALDRAHAEIGEIAKEGPARRWRMSIPAQPGRDSDLLIANGLDAGRLAVAELRVAREGNRHLLDRVEAHSAEGIRLENELRVARTQLGWVRVLLDASPFEPSRADALNTLSQIRQALTERDQEEVGQQSPGP